MVVPQMGSAFWSYTEAANRLGKTKRSIVNYVKRGLLTTRVQNGVNLIPREQVEQLAVDLGTGMPALNRQSFFELTAKVRKLEEIVAVMAEMLQLKQEMVRPNPQEAKGWYNAVSESLSRSGSWSLDEMTLWSLHFLKIDEMTLGAIEKVVLDTQPWTPFFRACSEMSEYAYSQMKRDPSPELLKTHVRLEAGHRHLRSVALVWMETHKGVTPQTVLKALDLGKSGILQRVQKG